MIYILGGRGFVGSAFARYCAAAEMEFAVLDRENYEQFRGTACTLLVNANGNSRKPLAAKDPLFDFDASVRSVRTSLLDFRFESYLHISSGDVYADCSTPAASREEVVPDPRSQSIYGFHKWLAEQCVRNGASRWLILRLGGMVGPGLKKNAVFDVLGGGPVWLQPESRLQYIHTDDVVRIAFELVERAVWGEVFNLSGSGTMSVAEMIAALGRDVAVQPGSPQVTYEIDTSRLAAIMPVPETRETVLRYIDVHQAAGAMSPGGIQW
jgi:nucleoside-diphosphate-sugar epimerase